MQARSTSKDLSPHGMHTLSERVLAARSRRRGRRGFTLLEALMTMVILGVGVLAFVEAQQSFITSNAWSSQAATATFLANEIREMTRKLPRHDPVTGLYLNGTTLVGWGRETGETTPADLDDIDDFDGLVFGAAGNMPGPINLFGEVIPEVDQQGNVMTDEGGSPIAMRGWTQTVTVRKINPVDPSAAVTTNTFVAATGSNPGRPVDRYPLKVTVVVSYQGAMDAAAREVTRVSWIVPE
jgi:prepilin-type N-terminal cleavage/methylation domain-containing protein